MVGGLKGVGGLGGSEEDFQAGRWRLAIQLVDLDYPLSV